MNFNHLWINIWNGFNWLGDTSIYKFNVLKFVEPPVKFGNNCDPKLDKMVTPFYAGCWTWMSINSSQQTQLALSLLKKKGVQEDNLLDIQTQELMANYMLELLDNLTATLAVEFPNHLTQERNSYKKIQIRYWYC